MLPCRRIVFIRLTLKETRHYHDRFIFSRKLGGRAPRGGSGCWVLGSGCLAGRGGWFGCKKAAAGSSGGIHAPRSGLPRLRPRPGGRSVLDPCGAGRCWTRRRSFRAALGRLCCSTGCRWVYPPGPCRWSRRLRILKIHDLTGSHRPEDRSKNRGAIARPSGFWFLDSTLFGRPHDLCNRAGQLLPFRFLRHELLLAGRREPVVFEFPL